MGGRYRSTLPDLPSSFAPNDQFLLRYTRIEDDLEPEGFSGAGAWVNGVAAEENTIWRPNPVLCGVVTGYFKKKKLLLLTRVGAVLALLDAVADGSP
jgi:hypothetical protein